MSVFLRSSFPNPTRSSMNIFPAQYSTLSTGALKDHIEKSYGLKNLTGKFHLRGVSDTYILENDDAKYIFKVYRSSHRSLTEIKGEVQLLTLLKERGAKVSYPIADLTGNEVQEFNAVEGIRHGVLFSFAPGKNIPDLTDKHLNILGYEMAFNHNITSQIELSYERKIYSIDTTLTQPIELLAPAFKDYREGYTYLKEAASQAISGLNSLDTKTFSYGYCHYDYLPKNFHFDDQDILTLFDFDFAGKGFLVNDLASFTVHLYFHITFQNMPVADAKRAFEIVMNAYRKVRPLSNEEIQAIPSLGVMFWIFYLGFQYTNFDDWSNFFFGPRYLNDRVKTIQRYIEIIPYIL